MAYEDRSYSGSAIETTLTANITATDTAIPIALTTGWPDGSGGPFHIAIAPANDPDSFSEVIRCTGRTGNTLNVQTTPVSGRGWDGTTPLAHITGAIVAHVVTATDLEEANQHITNVGLDHHPQYLTIARHDSSSRHGIGNLPVGGTPSASVPGDTSFSGTSGLLPRSDHKHARESFGTPTNTREALADGFSTLLARADHRHTDSPVICTSTTRPSHAGNLWNGQTIVETDTTRIMYFSTTYGWVQIGWTWGSGRMGATLHRSNYDIPSGGSPTFIPWSSESFDSHNFISPNGSTSTTFLMTEGAQAGLWMVSVVGLWTAIFTQRAFVQINHGPTIYRYATTGEDRFAATCMLTIDPLDVAEIQVGVYQESGSTRQVSATAEIYRIGL